MNKLNQLRIGSFSAIVLLLLSFLLLNCKKDKVPMIEAELEECVDIPDCVSIPPLDGYTLGYKMMYEVPYYRVPQFNPNNDNEILFKDGYLNGEPSSIYTYNMVTMEKQLVYYGKIQSTLSWSIKDWILFASGSNGRIYKIKSNGDSLTELTSTGGYFQPCWNYSGTKFITHGSDAPTTSYIHDEQGNILDTIDFWAARSGSWDHPKFYGGIDFNRISIVDVESKKIDFELSIDMSENPPLYRVFTWGREDEIIYSIEGRGLYRYNLLTKKQQLIKCNCGTNGFTSACTNRDRTKIVLVKTRLSLLDSQTMLSSTSIVLMDIDGANEVEIEIPV